MLGAVETLRFEQEQNWRLYAMHRKEKPDTVGFDWEMRLSVQLLFPKGRT